MPKIRPSSLPKLAACPAYVSDPNPSPAAERGTRIDRWCRAMLNYELEDTDLLRIAPPEDVAAVQWMVDEVINYADGLIIVSNKERCSLAPWDDRLTGGEVDCRIVGGKNMSFDFKTGELRNYRLQQACYAVALMESHDVDDWTCVCLFGDKRETVEYHFRRNETKNEIYAVLDAIAAYPAPRLCEYCSWCQSRFTCPLRNQLAETASTDIAAPDAAVWFKSVLASPEVLADFLTRASVLDDFVKAAKAKALEYIQNGASVPGWKMINVKGRETLPAAVVAKYADALGPQALAAAAGDLPAAKARKLWADALPDTPFPDASLVAAPGYSYLKSTIKR